MKLIAFTAFVALPSTNAIYYACCKRENKCPTGRINMEKGDASFIVCCYEEGKDSMVTTLDEIPTCLEDIAAGGGASISFMSLPEVAPPSTNEDCLVGDIMYREGDSVGFLGLECINSTHFDARASTCGPGGEITDTETVLSCSGSVPYCVQCGPRGLGAALCLSTPDEGNRDCGDDDEDSNGDLAPQPIENVTEATATSTNVCCAAIAVVQPGRVRSSPMKSPVCPKSMHMIDGAKYTDGGENYQVCCDNDGYQPSDFDIAPGLSMCEVAASTETPLESNDTSTESSNNTTLPHAQEGLDVDESNSASDTKNAIIIVMALVGVVLQVAL